MKTTDWKLAALLLPVLALTLSACSSDDGSTDQTPEDASTGPEDSSSNGADSTVSYDAGGSHLDATPGHDATIGTDSAPSADSATPAEGAPTTLDAAVCVTTTEAGTWANMACSATACDNLPGVSCGYTAKNGGQGYLCSCENPTWADPWGCLPADAGGGNACPAADAGTDASSPTDGATGDAALSCVTTIDGGTWANLSCSATACDDLPGVPCGYTGGNEGQGYLCTCENPTWADPWGCLPADAGGGKACPVPDAGHD